MMNLVTNYFSKAQDVLTDSSKDRLVNVYRNQSGESRGCMAGSSEREEQVQKGQDYFLDIRNWNTADKKSIQENHDIHFQQQRSLKSFFLNGMKSVS